MASKQPTVTAQTVSNVDPALRARPRGHAGQNERSTEATAQNVLSDTVAGGRNHEINLADVIRRRFELLGGVELEPHPNQEVGEPPSFDP